MAAHVDGHDLRGVGLAVAAYSFWGLIPVYWKHLAHVPVVEVLAHRMSWTLLFFAGLMLSRGTGLGEARRLLSSGRACGALLLTAALLGLNWSIFIYAISANRVLAASLGYFITPLVSVALGMVFLQERLRRAHWLAIGAAAAGVAQLAMRAPSHLWIAFALALSFGLYGLLRKTLTVAPLLGSTIESLFLFPVGLCILAFLMGTHQSVTGNGDAVSHLLLLGAGCVTGFPLLLFAKATKRLPLYVIGILQYLAPTGQFLLAVLVYREDFSSAQLRSFALVWLGLAIFTWDLVQANRRLWRLP
ncbi:MAG: EamA family transporter RarD [Candidatus Schekmanbacteria bacterium]|nr:EamA family transporter RarD [Candidatus Schekmanbacteria bacterium]